MVISEFCLRPLIKIKINNFPIFNKQIIGTKTEIILRMNKRYIASPNPFFNLYVIGYFFVINKKTYY